MNMATILVVDDEDIVRNMLVRFLIRHAHTVLAAKNGIEGLSVFQAHEGEIDLEITDVLMPEMSGPDLVYRLGLLPQKRPVRIVMMTGRKSKAKDRNRVVSIETGAARVGGGQKYILFDLVAGFENLLRKAKGRSSAHLHRGDAAHYPRLDQGTSTPEKKGVALWPS